MAWILPAFALLLTPVAPAPSGDPVAEVQADANFTCARSQAGRVWCWGGLVALAEPTRDPRAATSLTRATPVQDLDDATALAVDGDRACALRRDGTVSCWRLRLNKAGRVGLTRPGPVKGLTGIRQLGAGGGRTCAVDRDGLIQCWDQGRLPGPVGSLEGERQLAVETTHVCAAMASGEVVCWGEPGPELGGRAGPGSNFVQVAGVDDAVQVMVRDKASCAVRREGGLVCWGRNPELNARGRRPRLQAGFEAVRLAALGQSHLCGAVQGGMLCRGANQFGQLGSGKGFFDTLDQTGPGQGKHRCGLFDCRPVPHVRPRPGGKGLVLGGQRLRPARGRIQGRPPITGPSHGPGRNLVRHGPPAGGSETPGAAPVHGWEGDLVRTQALAVLAKSVDVSRPGPADHGSACRAVRVRRRPGRGGSPGSRGDPRGEAAQGDRAHRPGRPGPAFRSDRKGCLVQGGRPLRGHGPGWFFRGGTDPRGQGFDGQRWLPRGVHSGSGARVHGRRRHLPGRGARAGPRHRARVRQERWGRGGARHHRGGGSAYPDLLGSGSDLRAVDLRTFPPASGGPLDIQPGLPGCGAVAGSRAVGVPRLLERRPVHGGLAQAAGPVLLGGPAGRGPAGQPDAAETAPGSRTRTRGDRGRRPLQGGEGGIGGRGRGPKVARGCGVACLRGTTGGQLPGDMVEFGFLKDADCDAEGSVCGKGTTMRRRPHLAASGQVKVRVGMGATMRAKLRLGMPVCALPRRFISASGIGLLLCELEEGSSLYSANPELRFAQEHTSARPVDLWKRVLSGPDGTLVLIPDCPKGGSCPPALVRSPDPLGKGRWREVSGEGVLAYRALTRGEVLLIAEGAGPDRLRLLLDRPGDGAQEVAGDVRVDGDAERLVIDDEGRVVLTVRMSTRGAKKWVLSRSGHLVPDDSK